MLGMSLQPGFDLADPTKRNLFVYYSPRNAGWPTTGNAQVVGYNQISRFTLTEDGTAAVAGLRARDPARPQGQDRRLARPASPAARPTAAPATWAAPAWTSTPPATCTSASATTSSPNAPRPQRLRADGLPRQGALGRAQDVARTPPTCAARSSASRRSRATIAAGAEPGRGHDVRDPGGQPVPGRHGQDPSRDLRDGLPPAVHACTPTRPTRASWAWASTATTTRPTRPTAPRPARASGTCSTRRATTAGRSAWATTRRRTRCSAGTTRPTRRPASSTTATPADLPSDIRYAPDRPDAGRADLRRSGHAARPGREGDDLEEVRGARRPERGRLRRPRAPAACSRSPARSTATTRPRASRARSRATTTARG